MFLEKMYFPHDISTFGPSIDAIFLLIFWITMVTWFLVTVTMVVFLVKYRTRPGRKAEYIEGCLLYTSPILLLHHAAAHLHRRRHLAVLL